MPLEVTETSYAQPIAHSPFLNMRWSAVFAGLAVGISANLFLLLLGGAAGLAVFNTSAEPSNQGLLLAASIWNTLCMLVGAFVGGYVAARASGMRRTQDGLLHGAVAWGVTMLLSVLLATTAAGSTLSGMFSSVSARPGNGNSSVMRQSDSGDRQAALEALESRLGLTAEQANRVVDQALILAGREEGVSEEGRAEARQNLRTASLASGWLSAAVLLSLLSAMGGGMLGARATRRAGGRDLRRELHAVKTSTLRSTDGV